MAIHAVRFRSRNQHNVVGRDLVPDRTIQARQLLDLLPPPLPSVVGGLPILGPILEGDSSPTLPAKSTTPPAHAPTPVKSPSPPSSNDPNGGGGSSGSSSDGGGNSGGSSSSSGSSGSSSSGSGDSNGSSSSGSGGSSRGPSSAGGISGNSPSTPTPGTPSSRTTNNGPPTGIPHPDTSHSSGVDSNTSVLMGNTSNGSLLSSLTTQQSGGQNRSSTASESGSSFPPVANAGDLPLTETTSGSLSLAASNPSSTPGSVGTGTNNGGSAALGMNKHRISSGDIAAIVVLLFALLSLCVIVFILRRRSKIRRDERQTRWWFATNRASQTYGDTTNLNAENIPAGTHTARSSFVTTVDHSDSAHATYFIPPFPPAMAEIGRANGSRPTLTINTYEDNRNRDIEDNRFSIGSAGSEHSQYLFVPERNSANPDLLGGITPMSVRPFSPSESFAFPKPPEPTVGSSRPSSIAASTMLSLNANVTPPMPIIPLTATNNTGPAPSTIVIPATNPFADGNPFEDATTFSIVPTITHSTGPFSEIEIVRRQFIPNLQDELAVSAGDAVQVLHSFDDGWALVGKIPQGSHAKDGKLQYGEKGLIPIDCLRKPGQDLPAFIASKRISSYAESFVII